MNHFLDLASLSRKKGTEDLLSLEARVSQRIDYFEVPGGYDLIGKSMDIFLLFTIFLPPMTCGYVLEHNLDNSNQETHFFRH